MVVASSDTGEEKGREETPLDLSDWLNPGPLHLVPELCLKLSKQHFTTCLGNGRGDRRDVPSPVPCRNSLLGVMQMWYTWYEPPLSATPCHYSLREGQPDPVPAAGWTLH